MQTKRLLRLCVVLLLVGVLVGVLTEGVLAGIKQCTEWNDTCIDIGPPPEGGTYNCLLRRVRKCWDPDDPGYDWSEMEYGTCPCPGQVTPTPTPTPVPTPEPTPKPMAARATIYVTVGPNEWVELTSEDKTDIWWVGQADNEGGLILSIPLVKGLLHRFYNPAHKISVIRDLTTNQTSVDLHPDHGCKNCVRK